MRYSKLFGKSEKLTSIDEKFISHKFLHKAAFIRESTAGRFYLLPLGMRVHQKIMRIIKEEMDNIGAQEMLAPVLHPTHLWQETNRTKTVAFELMKVKDRNGKDFILGGTAEEMFVDLVRKFTLSYRDLPLNLYQFSVKFRDELRPRGGLLRVREFIMKDAYSFDRNETEFKKEYQKMRDLYKKIFARMDLETIVIEADNGYIGGEYCHEFVVESNIGESTYFKCSHCDYAAHIDVAKSVNKKHTQDKTIKPLKTVYGKDIIGVDKLVKYLKIPLHITTKTLLYKADNKLIAVMVAGNVKINETKLKNHLKCVNLTLANEEAVYKITGAKMGYAGPINLPKSVKLIADFSTEGRINFEAGANKTNYHYLNANFERDFATPQFVDLRIVEEGETCIKCKRGQLKKNKGIEVGNIFQLGYHYSKLMKNANFIDEDGKEKLLYMGCYGIGIGRTIAAIAEKHHDERGIIWPRAVSPYLVHLLAINLEDPKVRNFSQKVYQSLKDMQIEVLFDDRTNISAGVKFKDADLVGIPIRLLVSRQTYRENKVEFKERISKTSKLIERSFLFSEIKKQ